MISLIPSSFFSLFLCPVIYSEKFVEQFCRNNLCSSVEKVVGLHDTIVMCMYHQDWLGS